MLRAIFVVGLLAGPTAAQASPTTYDINFTVESGVAPASGQFTYDPAIPTFSNFVVVHDGHTFDVTASANSASQLGTGMATDCAASGAALTFKFMSKDACVKYEGNGFFWGSSYRDPPVFIFSIVYSRNPLSIRGTTTGLDCGTGLFPCTASSGRWAIALRDADGDGDGVLDAADVCPNTAIPESAPTSGALKNNQYALEAAPTFTSTNRTTFTTTDTGGCSCEQIVATLGLGQGALKFGCSKSQIDAWILGLP